MTPEAHDEVVKLASTGADDASLAAAVGVTPEQWAAWVDEGAPIIAEVERARARAALMLLATVRRAAVEGDAASARWLLERAPKPRRGRPGASGIGRGSLDQAADAVADGVPILDAARANGVTPEGIQRRLDEREARAAKRGTTKKPSAARQRQAQAQEDRARKAWRLCQDGADEYEIAVRLGVSRAQARASIALGRSIMNAAARHADEGQAEAMVQSYRREMARLRETADRAESDAAALREEGDYSGAARAESAAAKARDAALSAAAKLMTMRGLAAPTRVEVDAGGEMAAICAAIEAATAAGRARRGG